MGEEGKGAEGNQRFGRKDLLNTQLRRNARRQTAARRHVEISDNAEIYEMRLTAPLII